MPVSAVGAGDVVVRLQRLANAQRYRFLALVKVRQARHQSAEVKIVGALLEFPDAYHLPVHPQQPIDSDVGAVFPVSGNRRLSCVGHSWLLTSSTNPKGPEILSRTIVF